MNDDVHERTAGDGHDRVPWPQIMRKLQYAKFAYKILYQIR